LIKSLDLLTSLVCPFPVDCKLRVHNYEEDPQRDGQAELVNNYGGHLFVGLDYTVCVLHRRHQFLDFALICEK